MSGASPARAGVRIAEFTARFEGAPDAPTRAVLSRSLADTFGVAAGGVHEPAPQAALRYLSGAGLLAPPDASTGAWLWGTDLRAPAEIAAWWNGIAGHVLDYDDVTVPLRGHPSIVLWPAILALAQARDLPGRRAASAFVVGMEVMCKLARGIAVDQYAQGWHTTASIGALASAAACAHLLELTLAQALDALGLAVAQAAGSRENVGTEAKSFQAGHACAAGVRAAALAQEGYSAGPGALDGPHGYLRLYASGEDVAELLAGLGGQPLEVHRAGLDIKKYPMCYATHRALDAVLALRQEHGLRADDVRAVSITTSQGALVPLVHPSPACGLEGKFSMQYAMAAALIDGQLRLASFTDAAVRRPEAQALLGRVMVREARGPVVPRWAEVVLELADGRRLGRKVEVLGGSHQNPLSDAQLAGKIEDCLRWGRQSGDGAAVLAHCQAMPDQSVRELMNGLQTLVRPGAPAR